MLLSIARAALAAGLALASAAASTPEQADQAVEAFNRTYWNPAGKYFYKYDNKTGVLDFWLSAHAWETIMDVYVRTGKPEFRQQIADVYDGFLKLHGSDWTKNSFNDDIAWWIIAAARAYDVTGDIRYLNQAKKEFDWVYGTQRDTVKGGIWWKNDTHQTKNSCVVQPLIIGAALLAKGLNDDGYRVKAESLYAWERRTLVDANTGKVYDNINLAGSRSSYSSTYNQGTWIGSAVMLGHLDDARKCADWTKANMCNSAGVFREAGQGDVGGFKLIGARYIMLLARQPGQQSYTTWMLANADNVWMNRRADGIMGYDWNAPAPSSGIQAQCAAGGVSLLNLFATTNSSIRPRGETARGRNASAKVLSLDAGGGSGSAWYFGSPGTLPASGADRNGIIRRLDGRASLWAIPPMPE